MGYLDTCENIFIMWYKKPNCSSAWWSLPVWFPWLRVPVFFEWICLNYYHSQISFPHFLTIEVLEFPVSMRGIESEFSFPTYSSFLLSHICCIFCVPIAVVFLATLFSTFLILISYNYCIKTESLNLWATRAEAFVSFQENKLFSSS